MFEFYRRNQLILKIAIVALVSFVLCFIFFYGSNDLFDLPFNSEVWGTASDWVMITVTFFTAMYLVRTFEEQKRSNDDVADKHLKSIFPKFDIRQESYDTSDDIPSPFNMINHLIIKLQINDVRDLKFEITHEKIIHSLFDSPYVREGKDFTFDLRSQIITGIDSKKLPLLTLCFEDIEGNCYIQDAFIENNIVYFENAKLKEVKLSKKYL